MRPTVTAFALSAVLCATTLVRASAAAQTRADLLEAARALPEMPRESADLLRGGFVLPGQFTFGSGTPYNDLEYTLFDTDYMEGETNGFDTFMPVDPSEPFPGTGTVKLVRGVNNLDLEAAYDGARGDRIILGAADHPKPFFLRGPDGVDDDYAVIQNLDYNAGVIQLRGEASDYALLYATEAEGVATEGHYLFYVVEGALDLVAFVWPCDVLGSTISGNPPRDTQGLCNASKRIALDDGVAFRFAAPMPSKAVVPDGLAQIGTSGKEIVGGVAVDGAGQSYVFGASDGSIGGGLAAENTVFVAQVMPSGARGWTAELPVTDGTLLFDAKADDAHLYAVGRTLGALPGFTNAGRWDAIILKIALSTGEIVGMHQYGTAALDGYGNVELDGVGGLYVSGAGSASGQASTDPDYLVAKYDAGTLANVWRVLDAPAASGPVFVAEAWGGLSYAPASGTRPARLLTGGWYMSAGGSQGFLSLYEGLDTASPQRVATTSIDAPGQQADWVLDNEIAPDGTLYAAGYTTGRLGGTHRGDGDAFVVRYDSDLTNPTFAQVGTPQSDMFRKLELGADGTLYAIGYTYGDYRQGAFAGENPDRSLATGDVLVQRFASDLTPLGAAQIGTAGEDRAYGILRETEAGAHLHLGGMTEASLVASSSGSFDAFALVLDAATLAVAPVANEAPASTRVADLSVYPNPASGRVTFQLHTPSPKPVRITLIDMLGREVITLDGSSGVPRAFDASTLPPGVYLVRAGGSTTARLLTVTR